MTAGVTVLVPPAPPPDEAAHRLVEKRLQDAMGRLRSETPVETGGLAASWSLAVDADANAVVDNSKRYAAFQPGLVRTAFAIIGGAAADLEDDLGEELARSLLAELKPSPGG